MSNTRPHVHINLREVSTRNNAARRVIAGFSAALPTLAEVWQYLGHALSDATLLSSEIVNLSDQLLRARLDRANILAAARATLAAHDESEPDPLFYLRDELEAQGSSSERQSQERR
jgi:hypothetical protein